MCLTGWIHGLRQGNQECSTGSGHMYELRFASMGTHCWTCVLGVFARLALVWKVKSGAGAEGFHVEYLKTLYPKCVTKPLRWELVLGALLSIYHSLNVAVHSVVHSFLRQRLPPPTSLLSPLVTVLVSEAASLTTSLAFSFIPGARPAEVRLLGSVVLELTCLLKRPCLLFGWRTALQIKGSGGLNGCKSQVGTCSKDHNQLASSPRRCVGRSQCVLNCLWSEKSRALISASALSLPHGTVT